MNKDNLIDDIAEIIEEVKADHVPCYWDKEIAKAIAERLYLEPVEIFKAIDKNIIHGGEQYKLKSSISNIVGEIMIQNPIRIRKEGKG